MIGLLVVIFRIWLLVFGIYGSYRNISVEKKKEETFSRDRRGANWL